MGTGLADDTRLASTDITAPANWVAAIRPEADMELAPQIPTREQVQAEADKATHARRAIAVERERPIPEDELASKIKVTTREANLVTQEGNNQRRRAEEDEPPTAIAANAAAERTTVMANASAEAKTAKLAA